MSKVTFLCSRGVISTLLTSYEFLGSVAARPGSNNTCFKLNLDALPRNTVTLISFTIAQLAGQQQAVWHLTHRWLSPLTCCFLSYLGRHSETFYHLNKTEVIFSRARSRTDRALRRLSPLRGTGDSSARGVCGTQAGSGPGHARPTHPSSGAPRPPQLISSARHEHSASGPAQPASLNYASAARTLLRPSPRRMLGSVVHGGGERSGLRAVPPRRRREGRGRARACGGFSLSRESAPAAILPWRSPTPSTAAGPLLLA